MSTGLKANSDGSAAIQVGGTDVITLTSGGAATFVTSPTTVQAGTAAAPSITFSGDTNTGIYSPGADQVAIATGGTAAIYANSSQQVGIGTTSPSATLDVAAAAATSRIRSTTGTNPSYYLVNNTGGNLYIGRENSTGSNFGAAYASVFWSQGAYPIQFATNDSERMRINANAPVLCLAGGNTSATGTGIAFPATQSASSDANTLDDYEEGTWTPTLTFNGATTGITYSQQSGNYTKIGRLVTVRFVITLSNKGSSVGNAQITGLPFPSSSTSSNDRTTGAIYVGNTWSGLANLLVQLLVLPDLSNRIDINNFNGTNDANLTNTNFSNNSFFVGSITYQST